MRHLLILLFVSCTQQGTVIQKRTGLHYANSHTAIDVYAYQVAIADTFWVLSDINYEIGDTIGGR